MRSSVRSDHSVDEGRPRVPQGRRAFGQRVESGARSDSPQALVLDAPPPCGCPVCGYEAIRLDEVVDAAPVLLAECPRCEHRFTRALSRRAGTHSQGEASRAA